VAPAAVLAEIEEAVGGRPELIVDLNRLPQPTASSTSG